MTTFEEFFTAVHGYTPYPWQSAFANTAASGPPPSLVRTPTGSGKTGVLDALIWALAQQSGRPARERTVGVRIVWAIDRRILVDQVNEHAVRLAERLEAALEDDSDELSEVAAALASISGGVPLVTARWRGGIERDRSLIAPSQPQVITSTVGQIGSRMLFRGYGIADRSLALQAGLATCDSTICLDEAHLAQPFAQTAQWIRDQRTGSDTAFQAPPFDVISLTATPSERSVDQISLSSEDLVALGERLHGRKQATLDDAPGNDAERVKALVDHTASYLEAGARRVICVVNSVKRARQVFEKLRSIGERDDFSAVLLIGPQRPYDRAGAIETARPILEGLTEEEPIVCVATQAIEVGVDADADAMVTESASAAALTQRFGRLNRSGQGNGVATVVRDPDNWLYGDDEQATWEWLSSRADADGQIDISVAELDGDSARPEPTRTSIAPWLDEGVVSLLTQTNPRPSGLQEPDIETFLRGPGSAIDADVAICWRCDLHPDLAGETAHRYRETLLTLAPPQRDEQLTLSIAAAKGLIRARCAADPKGQTSGEAQALSDADVEGGSKVPARGEADQRADDYEIPYCVVRGDQILDGSLESRAADGRELIRPQDLKPGDVVVLASELGGVDEYGLAPRAAGRRDNDVAWDHREPIAEPAEPVRTVRLSRVALGIAKPDPESTDAWNRFTAALPMSSGSFAARDGEAVGNAVAALRDELPDHPALAWMATAEGIDRLTLRAVGSPTVGPKDMERLPEDGAAVLQVIERREDLAERGPASPPPTLEQHASSVAQRVNEFSRRLGFDPVISQTLDLAARAHDHGKADPRIQAYFRRGIKKLGALPIAKSEFGTSDPSTSRASARLAGLPSGLRHEIASVAILAAFLADEESVGQVDVDLALHLVATHHGYCRPVPPAPSGGASPISFRCAAAGISGGASGDGSEAWMDGAQLRRFWDVNDRYGPWGTAYLEAILMLADRTVSAEGR